MEFVEAAVVAVQALLMARDVGAHVRNFFRHRSAPGSPEPEWIPPTTERLAIVPAEGVASLVCAYFALRQATDERWHHALQQAYSVVLQRMLSIAIDPGSDMARQGAGRLHEAARKLATNEVISQEDIKYVLRHQAYAIALRAEFGIEGDYSPGTDEGPESLPI